ncbi:MAG TPA: outer membrane protein transport protein [Blastocatellia bacterium]|nr:outer membrane protein transport protein [Blastocatellia bacterium]
MNREIFVMKVGRNQSQVVRLAFVLTGVLTLGAAVRAQGLNYPVGSPTATSGAGNARTDPDNLFIRNNVAGMTEITDRDKENPGGLTAKGHWRFSGELQLSSFNYRRERLLPGPAQGITSETRFGPPGMASEVTYTSGDHKYAFGLGAYTIFGFQSKLKDPPELGPRATFFDTRVASNDFAIGGAVRLHRKLSVGGSFIFGRGFVDLASPNSQLAPLGIARQDRLDVAAFGAPGISVGLHFRPIRRLGFGLNYKTRRSYDLKGSLETFVPLPGGQILALRPRVGVKLKPPAVAEGGLEITATPRLQLFADFRFYDYTATFQEIDVRDEQRGQVLFALKLDAFDVRSFRAGGIYTLNDATRLHFGWAYTSNGFSDAVITPGTMNTGGFDIAGGVGRRIASGFWLNIGVAGILGLERRIGSEKNPLFPGRYTGRGAMLGIGLRW